MMHGHDISVVESSIEKMHNGIVALNVLVS